MVFLADARAEGIERGRERAANRQKPLGHQPAEGERLGRLAWQRAARPLVRPSPGGLRERAPRRIQRTVDGPWEIVLDGAPLGWAELSVAESRRMEHEREAEASTACSGVATIHTPKPPTRASQRSAPRCECRSSPNLHAGSVGDVVVLG